jgi:hypothetical protein
MSSAAWQEIRVGMTKGKAALSLRMSCRFLHVAAGGASSRLRISPLFHEGAQNFELII